MTERETKMEKAFESFLREVDLDKRIKFIQKKAWRIFKKIEEAAVHDPSVIERFRELLIDVSYLRINGIKEFDKSHLREIIGQLGFLQIVLQGIKAFKESKLDELEKLKDVLEREKSELLKPSKNRSLR